MCDCNVSDPPAACLKVCLEEVIEGPHVLLLGEEHMVGYVLHDLTHQGETSLHARGGLAVYDTTLTGRH